jgi:SCP-2 sterol transfer family
VSRPLALIVRWCAARDSDVWLNRVFGMSLVQGVLIRHLARCYTATNRGGIQGSITLVLTCGEEAKERVWTLTVVDGVARPSRQASERPTLVVRSPVHDLVRILGGQLEPLEAVRQGRVITRGSPMVALRLDELLQLGALGIHRGH